MSQNGNFEFYTLHAGLKHLYIDAGYQRAKGKISSTLAIEYKSGLVKQIKPHFRYSDDDSTLVPAADFDLPSFVIYGVLGIIPMLIEHYLMVILQKRTVAEIFGRSVFCIEKVGFIPLNREKAISLLTLLSAPNSDAELTKPPNELDGIVDANGLAQVDHGKLYFSQSDQELMPGRVKENSLYKQIVGKGLQRFNDLSKSIVGVPQKASTSTPEQATLEACEKKAILEMARLFRAKTFYSSYYLDLTMQLQLTFEFCKLGLYPSWKHAKSSYFWNEACIVDSFVEDSNVDDAWILIAIEGFVNVAPCIFEDIALDFVLIARRSKEMNGLRYEKRGADLEGNVANFVETEMGLITLMNSQTHVCSFVQIRGSVPLLWKQSPDSLKPLPILIGTPEDNQRIFSSHFARIKRSYGFTAVLSLIETTGKESVLGNEYALYCRKYLESTDAQFLSYDFHEMTRKSSYEQVLETILNDIEPLQQDKIGYYWMSSASGALLDQSGVIRTNCMDCLDRTNVVQASIARTVLTKMLFRLGIHQRPDRGLQYLEAFEKAFKNMWADHGDHIARSYAGTSALKGDFTRSGKRSLPGLVNDATNSLSRFYLNYFKDQYKQLIIDILLKRKSAQTLLSADSLTVEIANLEKAPPSKAKLFEKSESAFAPIQNPSCNQTEAPVDSEEDFNEFLEAASSSSKAREVPTGESVLNNAFNL